MRTSPVIEQALASMRLTTLLGSGRHGSVFLARGGTDSVAVKLPIDAPESHGRVCEAAALDRFDHPNIISLLAGPLRNGALVLEFCEGGSLAELMTNRPHLDAVEIAAVALPIVDALRHVHSRGWIHGDVAPSNIAFRGDGTPVLIDFATARSADAQDISEGNPAFVGPLRSAKAVLDVRALAATALAALGDLNRWDHDLDHNSVARRKLLAIIERADGGDRVVLDELEQVFVEAIDSGPIEDFLDEGTTDEDPAGYAVADAARSLPRFGSTESFGPRPRPPSSDRSVRSLDRRLLIYLVVALALLAALFEIVVSKPSDPRADDSATQPTIELAGWETLERFGAEWDSTTGTLTTNTVDGSVRWQVGEPGDLAAIGDWNCDGTETVGIYRPNSGSWFTFDTWVRDSRSTDPRLLDAGSRLLVAVDADGCAQPVAGG